MTCIVFQGRFTEKDIGSIHVKKKAAKNAALKSRGEKTRTSDPLHPMQVR